MAPSAFAGTNDNVTGWIWSGSVGWISMNCTNPVLPADPIGTCATVDYGVTLEDAGGTPAVANLQGYAWSETVGWVCFGTTCAGTTPEGAASYAQYRELSGGKADQFWGWAKVLALGNDGWIALNCDKDLGADECGTANYYVGLNSATGDFNPGVQVYDHFGWNGTNEGTGIGWIDFSIATTSWAPANLGTIRRPAGIYEPQSYGGACVTDANCTVAPHFKCNTGINTCVLPGTHISPFEISFVNFSGAQDSFLECEILLPDNSRRLLNKILSATVMNGSEELSYTILPGDATVQNSLWYITTCRLAGLRNSTDCTSDAMCSPGGICEEPAGKCRDILAQSNKRRPIFAHSNAWTGLGANQDQYSAIKCNAGFPNNYFKNAAQCDFTADASFALSMRRGIPVEGDCDDLVDNDGNGQVDCADRYCLGISYQCSGAMLPRNVCTWGQANDWIDEAQTIPLDDCSAVPEGSGICCSKQPLVQGSAQSHIVDGLECTLGDSNDGYYDCSCLAAAQFNASPTDDCFAPGAQPGTGDLCCDAGSNVIKL